MTIIRPDIGLIDSLLSAKCVDLSFINRLQLFQGRNPIVTTTLSIQSGVRLIEVFNNRN